ncbi:MAG: hypothetical protein R3C16_00490 [Hyphomonadaceae bacterium]
MTALVVLPTASSASVVTRTSLGSSDISAMLPALSVTGPKASQRATMMPASLSMVVTAMAMNRPASVKQRRCRRRSSARAAVDPIDTARPWITLVPWPDLEASATLFTGRKPVPV